jgi:hypothetical protein
MAKQTPYTVRTVSGLAKFSEFEHACWFALLFSAKHPGFLAEVGRKGELFYQCQNNLPTEEFKLQHECVFGKES